MLDILVLWGAKAAALLGVVIPFAPRRLVSANHAATVQGATREVRHRPGVRRAASESGEIRISGIPLTPAQHFDRVSSVIASALRSSQLATEMHDAARQQLEVVEFSIDRILDDVAEVMSLTPELLALRRPVAAVVPLHRRAA